MLACQRDPVDLEWMLEDLSSVNDFFQLAMEMFVKRLLN